MTNEQQIKALAELDGWRRGITYPYEHSITGKVGGSEVIPNYLTSYDAIIPLIQKQDKAIRLRMFDGAVRITILATPAQLCKALLRATNRWTE